MRIALIRKLLGTIAAGLAVLGVSASLAPEFVWPGIGLAIAALAVTWWQHRLNGLAVNQVPRVLAVTALIIAAVTESSAAMALPLLGAGVITLALIVSEPLLATAIATSYLESAHLPVRRGKSERWFNPRATYGAITALTSGLALGSAVLVGFGAGWVSWLPVGASLVVCLGFAAGMLDALRRRRGSAHSGDLAVRTTVENLHPEFLIHLAGPSESYFHLLMWLPYFDRLGDPYLIVVRNRDLLPRLVTATDTPIVVAPRIADVEGLLADSAKAVFYVNNSMENAQLVRTGHLTHIQLMHGDSDKLASRNPVSAMYDLIFVAGQAGIDRYHAHGVDIPDRKFRIVGRPQLHPITVGPRPAGDDGPVILYTPTWAGTSDEVDYSSLRIGPAIITALLDRGATVLLRAHPFTRHNPAAALRLAEMERLLAADAGGRAHRWGAATAERMSLADCVNAADYAVTDVSGAASDWLYSGKPFALTDMHGLLDEFSAELPLALAAYRIDADAANIGEVLTEMLGADPLAGQRAQTRTYYLGDVPPEHCVEAFLDAARAVYRSA